MDNENLGSQILFYFLLVCIPKPINPEDLPNKFAYKKIFPIFGIEDDPYL